MKKLVYGSLRGRGAKPMGTASDPDVPISGDAFFICDGGRGASVVLSPFKQHARRSDISHYIEHREISLILAQDAVKEKRMRNRGMIQQVVRWHVLTADAFHKMVPERKFQDYPGTNRGTAIGFIGGIGKASQTWTTTVDNKKAIYGANRIFGSDAAAADEDGEEDRKATDMEPVFFNYLPRNLYTNVLQAPVFLVDWVLQSYQT